MKDKPKSVIVCYVCRAVGHISHDCPEKRKHDHMTNGTLKRHAHPCLISPRLQNTEGAAESYAGKLCLSSGDLGRGMHSLKEMLRGFAY